MAISSTTRKLLSGATAVMVLTLGTGTAAFAVDSRGDTARPAVTAEGLRRWGAFRVAVRTAFVAAADALGTTPRELRSEMRAGPQSIAQIAGGRTDAVRSAVTAALSQKLDDAVANGRITAERAAKAEERLPQAVERFLNRVPGQHLASQ